MPVSCSRKRRSGANASVVSEVSEAPNCTSSRALGPANTSETLTGTPHRTDSCWVSSIALNDVPPEFEEVIPWAAHLARKNLRHHRHHLLFLFCRRHRAFRGRVFRER